MSGVKHTPGPWRMLDVSIVTGGGLTAKPVAQVWRRWEVEGGAEETEANARLIAAAPDLLEALRGAIEWMACVEGSLRDCQPFKRNLADYRAVVAKAEGRA